MADEVRVNGIDLSGYVANDGLAHGRDDAAKGETLAGLQDASLTVSGTWEAGMESVAALFMPRLDEREVVVQQPDGEWQAVKAMLARWWPLRWLRVRWRVYTTRGVPRLDPETGNVGISTTGPLTVSTVTRRGGR